MVKGKANLAISPEIRVEMRPVDIAIVVVSTTQIKKIKLGKKLKCLNTSEFCAREAANRRVSIF